jgi:hypothetical protein
MRSQETKNSEKIPKFLNEANIFCKLEIIGPAVSQLIMTISKTTTFYSITSRISGRVDCKKPTFTEPITKISNNSVH